MCDHNGSATGILRWVQVPWRDAGLKSPIETKTLLNW